MRHRDHRSEWIREQFTVWCDRICAEHGNWVKIIGVGPGDEKLGSPSQMAVFRIA